MTSVDKVLLIYEFGYQGNQCPDCGADVAHMPMCLWDHALSERGYTTRASRDAALRELGPLPKR